MKIIVDMDDICEDCISREEVINDLKLAYFDKDIQSAKNDPCVIDAMIDWAIRTVKTLPSVYPRRKKGKWKYIGDGAELYHKIVECSVCNRRQYGSMNYCGWCGSYMRGDEDE